ncbi:MAG: N-carbamoylputrescine amidase [Oscillospiraceae bacterium]|nr:N-carbamoylputrescine amidase [Oscillospiraceae bacterium]
MSRKVTAAAVQMSCSPNPAESLAKAERMIRQAAKDGAQIILLPELFERQYFCQERRYDYYAFATKTEENPAVLRCMELAAELGVVLPVSFYERDGNRLYNSAAIIDADGSLLGVYRKTHIPDDHYYQEKFYFSPGNTGFLTWQTRYARIGVGICWDQWFPETARSLALNGAELLFFPTAIGSEPILETDSAQHWRTCMQGHAAANIMPVIAANRIGTETVTPCPENGGQSSALCFYGSSFLTTATGAIAAAAGRDEETVLMQCYDLDDLAQQRLDWGIYRDRRPHCYGAVTAE